MSKKDLILSPRKKKTSGKISPPFAGLSRRNSTRDSLDMKNFDVNFNSIFSYNELGDSFFDFLESEYNSEPYLCLEQIELLKKKKGNEEKMTQVKLILEKFIEEGSDYEVNISSDTKKGIYQKLDEIKIDRNSKEWKSEEQPIQVFAQLKKNLLSELHHDNFPRYIRSERASAILTKYQSCTDVLLPKVSVQFPFTDENFSVPFISDDEFNFMEKLISDSFDWNLIMSKNGIQTPNVYLSNLNFLPNSKLFENSTSVKVEGIIPLNVESIACTMFGPAIRNIIVERGLGEMETTKIFTKDEIMEKYPDTKMERERKSFITDIYVKGVFPVNTPRRSRIVETIDYNPHKGTISYLHKPFILDEFIGKDMDWKKKLPFKFKNFKTGEFYDTEGYFSVSMHYIYLERLSENTTKVVHVIVFNPRGLITNPRGVLSIIPKFASKFIEGKISKIQENAQNRSFEVSKDEMKKDALTSSLIDLQEKYCQEFMDKFKEKEQKEMEEDMIIFI